MAAGIQQVCKEIGIPVGTLPDGLDASVDYIADDKSGTEVLRALLDIQQTADKAAKKDTYYLPVCINGQVNVIKKGELIDGYVATAGTNTFSTEHSESIENMVNRIKAVDDNGTICQMFTINDDVTHYGMIQKIYKMQPPKPDETVDNVTAAKAQLARLKDESSLKGLGNVQCITGYSIKVQEEQLTGTFYIKSDTHNFENNVHTMDLTLEYIPDQPEQPEIEQVDYATPVFNSSKDRMKNKEGISNGSADVDAGISAGWDAWGGQTMNNGREGCAEFVGKCGSYYSPFLAQEATMALSIALRWWPMRMQPACCRMIPVTYRRAMSLSMVMTTTLLSTMARAAITAIAHPAMSLFMAATTRKWGCRSRKSLKHQGGDDE